MAMNVSTIHLHGLSHVATNGDRCHWCEATLEDDSRRRRLQAGYTIEAGRRLLIEVELWACLDCADRAETLSDVDRTELQRRLDDMSPPIVGRCEACEEQGELFAHFDHDEGDEYLLCERCLFETP
jgi:hypothetical protein